MKTFEKDDFNGVKSDDEFSGCPSPFSFTVSNSKPLFPAASIIYSSKRQVRSESHKNINISISSICFNNAYNGFLVFYFLFTVLILLEC